MSKPDPSPASQHGASRARVARCGTAAPASLVSAPATARVVMRDHIIAVGHPTDKALRLFFSRYPKKKALRRRRFLVRGRR